MVHVNRPWQRHDIDLERYVLGWELKTLIATSITIHDSLNKTRGNVNNTKHTCGCRDLAFCVALFKKFYR